MDSVSSMVRPFVSGEVRMMMRAQGYAVVKSAIDTEKARQYQQRAFAWLKSFRLRQRSRPE